MAEYYDVNKQPIDEDVEERYQPKGKSLARRCWSGICASFGNVLMLLLVVLLALNLRASTTAGSDIGWPWSGDRIVRHSYGRDERFMSLDHKYDPVWTDFEDANTAIIHVDGPGRGYNGSIGMFHAMHCVWAMRHALQRAHAGENIGIDQNDDAHWPHCFDYLRQAILCAADDTIERAHWTNKTVAPDSYNGAYIEGQLDVRKCRDSEKLYELRKTRAVLPPTFH